MKRLSTIALAALLSLGVLVPMRASAAESGAGSPAVRVPALQPQVPIGATRLGAVAPTQQLTIDVVLRPAQPAALAARLESLYDPTSPDYEHWLTPDAFARDFGPSRAAVSSVTAWFRARGLSDTRVEGSAVRASGSAQQVSAALGVSFSRYRLAGGAVGYAASAAPLVPRALTSDITAILGLSDTVRFHDALDVKPHRITPGIRGTAGAVVPHANAPKACTSAKNFADNSFWTPDQVAAIYGTNDLVNAGMDGSGKKIALVELAPSRTADTNAYLACFALHNKVTVVKLDGGGSVDQTGTLEAEIDIQEAATTAPGAAIVSYEGPNSGTGEYDVYNRIVHDDVAVVSTSWGLCESMLQSQSPGFMEAVHELFVQAAAQGQSVFAASSDQGSEDCYDSTAMAPDESLQVDHPADDPLVTGVGGTELEAPGIDPVWNDCEAEPDDTCAASGGGGGGGGESTQFVRPAWQPLAPDATCPTCRGVPDISSNAGVGEVFFDSDAGGAGWIAVGGTSIASPKLAGLAANIDTGCATGRIGDFARKADALAVKHAYGTALRDVTTGLDLSGPNLVVPGDNDVTRTNGGKYHTATGFDLATGFGTPIPSGLSCALISSVTPTAGKPGDHVILHGLGLEAATIKFGSATATVLSATAKSATVIVPPGSGTVQVSGSNVMGAATGRGSFSYPAVVTKTAAYRMVAADGGIFDFGGAPFHGSPAGSLRSPIVGAAAYPATGGYWLASADGDVHFFAAPFRGSLAGKPLNQPIVGIASTPTGNGYWLVARDGGVFAFGDAGFFGSTGAIALHRPIVGMVASRSGHGYWLVASDGGVFAFGDAPFLGSTGAITLNQPIVGMAADPVRGGYWLVASDGGVFAFDAPFLGSTGAITLNQPIVAIMGVSIRSG